MRRRARLVVSPLRRMSLSTLWAISVARRRCNSSSLVYSSCSTKTFLSGVMETISGVHAFRLLFCGEGEDLEPPAGEAARLGRGLAPAERAEDEGARARRGAWLATGRLGCAWNVRRTARVGESPGRRRRGEDEPEGAGARGCACAFHPRPSKGRRWVSTGCLFGLTADSPRPFELEAQGPAGEECAGAAAGIPNGRMS